MTIDFHSLYEHYAQDVYRFALYLSGDPGLAEDLAAETFVRAWVTPTEIRASTVKAYLFTIVRNLYHSSWRHDRLQVELGENLTDPSSDPERLTSLRQDLQAVLKALEKLPEIDRATLIMHVQHDMPYAEIASVLGISISAVKVKVHRSRLKLIQILGMEK